MAHNVRQCRAFGCGACCYQWSVRSNRLDRALLRLPEKKQASVYAAWRRQVAATYAR
jgi:hypothetical protein